VSDNVLYKTNKYLPKDMSLWDDSFGAPFGWQFPKWELSTNYRIN
jgi:hypothetical protein